MTFGTIMLIAIGGVFAFEGVLWAIYPGGVRRIYTEAFSQLDDRSLHLTGLVSVGIGVGLIALAVKMAA